MKEASGELSMTAVAVVAIAAIGVIFTTLIWPNLKSSLLRQQRCSSAVGCVCSGETCNCQYYDDGSYAKEPLPIVCDNPDNTSK